MIIRCAWCKKILGEKPPYEDKGYTDTICEECLAIHFPRMSEKIAKGKKEGTNPIPEQAKIPEYLGKCDILHIHDDGDLTIQCGGKKYVVTTEGEVFKEFKGIVDKPHYLTLNNKLVGMVFPCDEGYALYREE